MKLVLLGAPGVGKGTAARLIKEKLGVPHISTGDLLRGEVKNNTETGKKAKEYMDAGDLVPDEVVMTLLTKRLSKDDCRQGFILDGEPRNLSQAKELDRIIGIDYALYLHAREETIIHRISGRRTCQNCGKIYHIETMPPRVAGVCDVCGGKIMQRSDAKREVVKERLDVYHKQTEPVIKYYKDKGTLIGVDAEAKPEMVAQRVLENLGK